MSPWRFFQAMSLLGLVCVVIPQGDEDEIEVNYGDIYFNEIPEVEQQEGTPFVTPTATPCKMVEFTKWDKLFTMLENSQMKENMLLQYTDNIVKVELQSLRGEMLQFVAQYGGSCASAVEGAGQRIHTQLEQRLQQEMGEQRAQLDAALQQLLATGRNQAARLAKLEGVCLNGRVLEADNKDFPSSWHPRQEVTEGNVQNSREQMEKTLMAMANELKTIRENVDLYGRMAAGQLFPSGCDMGLLFPMRSPKTHAEVTPRNIGGLGSLTVCLWIKPIQPLNKTVLFSYGTTGNPLELQLVLTGRSAFFTVGGEAYLVEAQKAVEEGTWSHLCGTWSSEQGLASLWVNGQHAYSSPGVAEGHVLPAGGVMLLGQEYGRGGGAWRLGRQDTFETELAFAGKMTGVNMWSRVLAEEEISEQAKLDGRGCGHPGDVVAWGATPIIPKGGVELMY